MQTNTRECPGYQMVDIIERRWAGAVDPAMPAGISKFSHVRTAIPGITDRVLAPRLKDPEADGIFDRRVLDERPVRIEYRPTERARALSGVVGAMASWADAWVSAGDGAGGPAV